MTEYYNLIRIGIWSTLSLGAISILLGILSILLYFIKSKYSYRVMLIFIISAFINFIPLGIIDYKTPFPIYDLIPNFKRGLQIYAITICLCIIPLYWKGKGFFPLVISMYCLGFGIFMAYPLIRFLQN